MGINETIQNAINKASFGELEDAFRTVQFISVVSVYDNISMVNVNTEVSTDVWCSVQSEFEGERIDEATLNNNVRIIILDNQRNGVEFSVDMIVKDGTNQYVIKSFNTDPAIVAWTVYARRLG